MFFRETIGEAYADNSVPSIDCISQFADIATYFLYSSSITVLPLVNFFVIKSSKLRFKLSILLI